MKAHTHTSRSYVRALVLIVSVLLFAHHLSAQNYLTIYRNDGVGPAVVYHEDIDSMVCSYVDMNGVEHANVQVQEIWLEDTVYRIPLAAIDSITMKKISYEEVIHNITPSILAVGNIVLASATIDDAKTHLAEIKAMDWVRDTWVDGNCLYVDFEDFGVMPYLYPEVFQIDEVMEASVKRLKAESIESGMGVKSSQTQSHPAKRVSILYQPYSDEKFSTIWQDVSKWGTVFSDCGLEPHVNLANFSYFNNDIFHDDVIFLLTHGGYDGETHWLCTSSDIYTTSINNPNAEEEAEKAFSLAKIPYSRSKVSMGHLREIHNGKAVSVYYLKLSEAFFSSKRKFDHAGSVVMFNSACKSLHNNDNLAHAFIRQGVGSYLGFTWINSIASQSGKRFFENMLSGMCVKKAYESLPNSLKQEHRSADDSVTFLRLVPGDNGPFIISPSTSGCQRDATPGKNDITLHGKILSLDSKRDVSLPPLAGDVEYGFAFRKEDSNLPPTLMKASEWATDPENNTVTWGVTIHEGNLQPNTTYIFQPYIFDQYGYSYGEEQTFTTKPSITTKDATDITSTTATLNCYISGNGKSMSEWTKMGFIISTSEDNIITNGQRSEFDITPQQGNYHTVFQGLAPNQRYYYLAYLRHASDPSLICYGDIVSFTTLPPSDGPCPDDNHPHMVDLGIGVKWACCNVGAHSPEEYGGYYAWGETSEKDKYSLENYRYTNFDSDGYWTGYYTLLGDHIGGTAYDVARTRWNAPWRMPTVDEIHTLVSQCKSEWTKMNGVKGRKFTGPNGNYIFLPAAGLWGEELTQNGSGGCYWTDTFYPESMGYTYAYIMYIYSRETLWNYEFSRHYGCSVRPVAE